MSPRVDDRCAPVALLFALALGGCVSAAPLPPKAIELNAEGAQAIATGDLATAEARLSVALEYNPRFVEAWVNLGYVELKRGNFEQAQHDFLRARDLNPDIPAPHHALGLLAERQGRGEEAERHYRDAIKVDPGFPAARVNLARRLYARGQYENAREQFERLMQVAPDEIEGWAGESETLLQLGREGESRDNLERARARFGDEPPLLLLLAREQLRRGDWDAAEATLAPMVGGLDQGRAGAAWAWIALARVGRGDLRGAEEAAAAALAIDRSDPVALYARGLAQKSPGK